MNHSEIISFIWGFEDLIRDTLLVYFFANFLFRQSNSMRYYFCRGFVWERKGENQEMAECWCIRFYDEWLEESALEQLRVGRGGVDG
jgi:hypothetical protein